MRWKCEAGWEVRWMAFAGTGYPDRKTEIKWSWFNDVVVVYAINPYYRLQM